MYKLYQWFNLVDLLVPLDVPDVRDQVSGAGSD